MSEQEDLAELQRNWTPPMELAGSGPREVKLRGAGIAMVCLASLMFLGGIAVMVGLGRKAAQQASETASLRTEGVEAQAVVTRHWRSGGKENTPQIEYEFEHEGRTYHGWSAAPLRIWRAM